MIWFIVKRVLSTMNLTSFSIFSVSNNKPGTFLCFFSISVPQFNCRIIFDLFFFLQLTICVAMCVSIFVGVDVSESACECSVFLCCWKKKRKKEGDDAESKLERLHFTYIAS